MKIHLHIDHLMLEGLEAGPARQAKIKAACEDRLVQLLRQGGVATRTPPDDGSRTRPPAVIPAGHTRDPVRLGQGIAQFVYGRVKP
jgi:hypothetical protein